MWKGEAWGGGSKVFLSAECLKWGGEKKQLPVFLNGNTSILTHKLRWFPTPNEDRTYLRCLKLKISKMWLPLQYIALSAHKSSDAIVINLLNILHREEEWRKKENYGGKSRRMDVTFWRMKRRLNPKKTHRWQRGSMEETEVENE